MMPVYVLDFDPLVSTPTATPVRVAVDPLRRDRGLLTLTLQRIPKGQLAALLGARQSAVGALTVVLGVTAETVEKLLQGRDASDLESSLVEASANAASVEARGRALQLLHRANRGLVRWGVADHDQEDWYTTKAKGQAPSPTPFVAEEFLWEGDPYRLAGEPILRLYEHPRIRLTGRLSEVVRAYQDDTLRTPEEEWAAASAAAQARLEEGAASGLSVLLRFFVGGMEAAARPFVQEGGQTP